MSSRHFFATVVRCVTPSAAVIGQFKLCSPGMMLPGGNTSGFSGFNTVGDLDWDLRSQLNDLLVESKEYLITRIGIFWRDFGFIACHMVGGSDQFFISVVFCKNSNNIRCQKCVQLSCVLQLKFLEGLQGLKSTLKRADDCSQSPSSENSQPKKTQLDFL